MKHLRLLVIFALLLTSTQIGRAAATCGVNGTISATEATPGQWTYCIDLYYFTDLDSASLTRLSVFLPQCAPGCQPNMVSFPVPVGSLSGLTPAGDACPVQPVSLFYCAGDPEVNAPRVPTVAWSVGDMTVCRPTMPGIGSLCFTTTVAPSAPREQTNAITLLSPTGQCWGTLKGGFPGCFAPVPVQESHWGSIKGARYSR